VSTDQQYVGGGGYGGRMGYQHEQMHERRIPVHDRFVPFLAPFLMTMIVVPLVESISWLIGHLAPSTVPLLVMGWMATGFITGIVGVLIGRYVTKRTPLIYWGVGVTALLWGVASAWTTGYGWNAVWGIVHGFGSLLVGVLWDLLRIDSLRTQGAQGNVRNPWGEVIGLRTSTPRKIERTPSGIEIEVAHGPGETRDDVRAAAKKIESAIDAVAGRTTVSDTADGRSGSSLIRLSLVDVFKDWWDDPGPSHPGGTFALPLRIGYYETGEYEWLSFASSVRSPLTSFRSEMDTFLGLAGTTGSGKSGGLNGIVREALTRKDVIVCWLDRAKVEQNAGWCLDMLGMAANDSAAQHFTKALRKLAEYRVKLFGQVALNHIGGDPDDETGRKWTPELARETGEAAVLVVVDEADTAIHGANWEWLSARGRSLGIFLCAATPRASAAEVPALVRGSIGSWMTFAIGDNYSDGFTLSSETMDAGADPKRLRAPGLHYLDRMPGVDLRHASTLARIFRSSVGRLRQSVLKYRGVTFQPMGFTQAAMEAMGDDYRQCIPARLLPGWQPPTADDTLPDGQQRTGPDAVRNYCIAVATGAVAGTPDEVAEARRILAANNITVPQPAVTDNETPSDRLAEGEDEEEDDEMTTHPNGTDELAGVARPISPESLYEGDELAAFRRVDLDAPINPNAGPEIAFRHSKPVWEPEQTERELDRVIVTFARAGKRTFVNQDVLEAMRCYFDPSTCSRRLTALDNGARTAPGGLTVRKTGRGEFEIMGQLQAGPEQEN
jgi:hypothetical protein